MQTSRLLATVLAAALVRVGPATDVPQLVPADDETCASCDGQAVELLQSRVSAARAGGGAEDAVRAARRSRLGSERAEVAKAVLTFGFGSSHAGGTFDCGAHPRLCTEPFNCNGTGAEDWARALAEGATGDGPNFQTWCAGPQYEEYVSQCIIDRDLVGAGRTYHDQAEEGLHGPDTYELDASYCFLEGFCLNTAVTNDTTVEEATHMCNQRYGDRWRTAENPTQTPAITEFAAAYDPASPGFPSRDLTTPFVLLACMMGNYHCDVMMCKATHCQDQGMVARYGHFLTDLGWDENTEPWFAEIGRAHV